MSFKNPINLTNLTLLVALALSAVAAYYSIIGLTAIFAGAVIPVIVMGSILEIGKITTTVWLKKYWKHCGWLLKSYLVPAVVALAILTSMGIFGFLSKAHMEQGVTSGDVQAKLAIVDEKIKTQRENIEISRKALQQMDQQVDARLSRGDNEQGAERAVQIRRQQQGERGKLLKDISDAQKEIAKLNEERAPIAAENRKVEAEVGPIKYVAALIYGDNPDANLLERAVRWVIILLVVVFDPLAIALVLAANSSREWDKKIQDDINAMNIIPPDESETRPFTEEEINALDGVPNNPITPEIPEEPIVTETQEKVEEKQNVVPTLLAPSIKHLEKQDVEKPQFYTPKVVNMDTKVDDIMNIDVSSTEMIPTKTEPVEIITEGVTKEPLMNDLNNGYVVFNGKQYSKNALKEMKPELFIARPDEETIKTNFGIKFPNVAKKGDIFVRVDVLPNRVFKFTDGRWIEINKDNTDSYLYDQEYVKYLVDKISSGEYDVELLTDSERIQIEEYLKNQNA